ncbi:MAG: M20/M25/M40 family metallo-hydrolase [bacterium]|nr:M20/M25/M40 family metallo-hydrolase [Candidatus Margulisiibacteriota bacterium]
MINKKRLIQTFKDLVKIDSLSLKEGTVVAYLKKELKAQGLRPYEVGRPEEGEVGSLIADLPGKGKRILLNAHVDTVSPGKKIKPVQKGNHIYSEGHTVLGADDKTGVAVILEVLQVLKERKIKHPPLRMVLTVAEEIGLVGARCLPKRIFSGDFCITLDHGKPNEIVYKAPAQQNITAKIYGKSAHAGIHPEQGINAIKVASIAIAKMRFGRIDNETTSNIGVISGGKATNIVPDRVEIRGEARSHNPKKLKREIEQMKKVLAQTCAKFGAKLKIKVEKIYNSFEIKKSTKVMRLAISAVKEAGLKPVLQQTGGGSDANIFNAAGIPTVILGSGMHQVHTTKEYANINEIVQGAEILLGLIGCVGLKGI